LAFLFFPTTLAKQHILFHSYFPPFPEIDFRWRHGGYSLRPAWFMSTTKLTKRTLDALAATNRPYIAFDADLAGFGVRVMPTGVKSWIVEYRPHGGGRTVAKRRVTLGKVGAVTPGQARRMAADMLAQVRLGGDPASEKAERRKAVTVGELLRLFDEQYIGPMLKSGTAVSHRIALDKLRRAHGAL
jgi:hypothetical protein